MVAKRREQAKTSRSERPRRRHLDDGSFVRLPPVFIKLQSRCHLSTVSIEFELTLSWQSKQYRCMAWAKGSFYLLCRSPIIRKTQTGLVTEYFVFGSKKYEYTSANIPNISSCVSKITIIGSDSGLTPSRHQAIICTNAGIVLIRPSGTNFSEILIEIHIFYFQKMHLKMSPAKCRPFFSRSQCIHWVKFIPNRRHEQAVMKLWRVRNIIGMSIQYFFNCHMYYAACFYIH